MFSALNIRYYSVKSKNGIISFIVSILIFLSHSALLIWFWHLITKCINKQRLIEAHYKLIKNELKKFYDKIDERDEDRKQKNFTNFVKSESSEIKKKYIKENDAKP